MTTDPEKPVLHPEVPSRRVRTPTVLQIEAVECGAASLAMILGYHGHIVPLEQLRQECGVSRDGSKASNINRAARSYGLDAKGFRKHLKDLWTMELPMIVFWNFNHFVVLEGFNRKYVYLNDPAQGRVRVTHPEFDAAFTGVVLTFEKTDAFQKGGRRPSLIQALTPRLKGSWSGLIYIIIASLLLVLTALVVPTFSLVFIDDILVNGRPWIGSLLLVMALFVALTSVLTWYQQKYLLRLETKLSLGMSTRFFWHIFRLPIVFFTQRYSGDLVMRIEINDRVADLLSGEMATNLLGVVMIGFYAVLMLQYDVTLTLVGVVIVIINMVALRVASQQRDEATRKLRVQESKIMGTSMNGIQIIETLKAGGSETDFFAKWSGEHAKTLNAEQNYAISSKVLSMIPALLTQLGTIAILIIGSLRVIEGGISIGMLVAFQALMLSFLHPVNQLVNLGGRLQDAESDLTMLDDVLKYERDPQTNESDGEVAADGPIKLAGYVDLVDVTFGYSPMEPPLLDNISISLKPGQRVALVGSSGSGKSTIARLITGLYKPWKGQILFDGQPRDEIPRHIMSHSLAMVDQDIFMFEGSIRENLSLWDQTIPLQDIVQAAKDAAIHADVSQRPGGYESKIAEAGRNFSGGQRQRLEIARSLVKNPSVLVLDEATSALDPVTEKLIDDNIRRRGCTCIIVAHRLSTIRDCDEIIVFDQGKIVQRGTHDDMIRQNGPYSRLIKAEESQNSENLMESILNRLDF